MALIVDDILLAPIKALMWLGQKIEEMAEEEVNDESKLHERLLELQVRYELGDITDEEFDKAEEAIVQQISSIRDSKESND